MGPHIRLNNGTTIPALGWGNMGGPQKALEAGAWAIEAGITHIDTAQIYGTEGQVKSAIEKAGRNRKDIYVTTKLWSPAVFKHEDSQTWRVDGPHLAVKDVQSSVESSLSLLGFQPDLLLIHNPFIPEPGKLQQFWKELEGIVEKGVLNGCSLGLSNFRPVDIEAVMETARIKPVVNQVEYHPYVLAHLDALIETHAKHSIVTQSYATLTPAARHPTGGPLKPILRKIADRLSLESGSAVDEAGVLLVWARTKGVVCVTSSGDRARIQSMAATQKLRTLSVEEVKEIEEAGRKIYFRAWPEHLTHEFQLPDLPSDLPQ